LAGLVEYIKLKKMTDELRQKDLTKIDVWCNEVHLKLETAGITCRVVDRR